MASLNGEPLKPSTDYIVIDGSKTLRDALHWLQQKNGHETWILVVRTDEKYLAARFTEFRTRIQLQQEDILDIPLKDLGKPLRSVAEYDAKGTDSIALVMKDGEITRIMIPPEPEGDLGQHDAEGPSLFELVGLTISPVKSEPKPEGVLAAHKGPDERPPSTPPTLEKVQATEKTDTSPDATPADKLSDSPPVPAETAKVEDKHGVIEKELEGPDWLVRTIRWLRKNAIAVTVTTILTVAIPIIVFYSTDFPKFVSSLLNPPTPTPRPQMTGEWNIAVARFINIGDETISQEDIDLIAAVFYNRLVADVAELSVATDVIIQVWAPTQTGFAEGATPEERAASAEALAREINAHVIIYGTVERSGELVQLKPEFYIAIENFYEAEEMVGHHSFGGNINIMGSGENLPSQINLNRELSRRSQSLSLITRGLSLYFIHDYESALALFEEANSDEYWPSNDGREVLYLFQGNAAGRALLLDQAEEAFRKALDIQPEYARGYDGLGSVYYLRALQYITSDRYEPDMESLELAIEHYEKALEAEIQPPTADVPTKTAIGLGQIYLAQALAGEDTVQQAIEQFQFVIEQYGDGANPRVREFAAEAYARLGFIYRQAGYPDTAVSEFQSAIELSTTPSRRAVYWAALADLYAAQDLTTEAEDANRRSIEQFAEARSLTRQPHRQAEYWIRAATRYEHLNEVDEAVDALENALDLLSQEAEDLNEAEQRQAQNLAAEANETLGRIKQRSGDLEAALEAYLAAIEFSPDPGRRGCYWAIVAEMHEEQDNTIEAEEAYREAIDSYMAAVDLTNLSTWKASYWATIADLYERLEEVDEAIKALEQAVNLLPEGSEQRTDYEERLTDLTEGK